MQFIRAGLALGVALCLVATAGLAKESQKLGPMPFDPSPYPPIEDGTYWPAVETVSAAFIAAFDNECGQTVAGQLPEELAPDVWELAYNEDFDADDEPPRRLTLYRFDCASGAYNRFDIYMMVTEQRGLVALEFAEPVLSNRFSYSEDLDAGQVIEGWSADSLVSNSDFDPGTLQITTQRSWRGLGDAFSRAVYELVDGQFVLRTYEVDASYDNKATPELVFDHGITR